MEYDLIRHIEDQKEFSLKTFGPGMRTLGVTNHIRQELDEIIKEPEDLYEWVDVILHGLDGAWRSGASPSEIAFALFSKLEKNKSREWPDWREFDENQAINHVKEA